MGIQCTGQEKVLSTYLMNSHYDFKKNKNKKEKKKNLIETNTGRRII